jgi:hypothetical protein
VEVREDELARFDVECPEPDSLFDCDPKSGNLLELFADALHEFECRRRQHAHLLVADRRDLRVVWRSRKVLDGLRGLGGASPVTVKPEKRTATSRRT